MNKFIGSFANKTGSIYDLWECDDRYNLVKSGTDKNEVHCAYSDVDWLFKMKGFTENPYNE